ncbi:3-hydroxyacyl-CoA dehydrogenase NAD-binding domain-containing protein [Alkalihalobacillus sp. LMS6]|uniref:3-hydroxyacyl-CoA dehydrogenase/enoyl-CoA hydratase family protein n=1 Tax=Alkalihalobacillus sp. LMS6 TaxID=2924034 RepID=UPI0020D1DD84|nr:3-hydroxyacyl-CoA dehydrogenase NAD-binding domain-containing protein [Alkalihalobacillus sp. LMS6]UTR05543.1 3-hydroxyacyl-CoA dehydrogenase NAD-binding domain-containing protein [Alkalihalobacillus sp. LMS6]
MSRHIKKTAVIGSGVMGASIAAHLANAGTPVLLLDIVPKEKETQTQSSVATAEKKHTRNQLADTAVKKLLKQKPAPLSSKKNIELIETGNLEDDLSRLSEADWIIEVIIENLDAKKELFAKIDEVRKEGSIVSSNTSGISIEAMSEGRSADFKAHFLGTHFFNPPRYLKLLEVIPVKETNQEVIDFVRSFAEESLGKGVVEAKDTPNFIANRIGTYGLLVTVHEMLRGGYSVGEVDSVTGTLIGRPKSATFRTLDVVGLDTFLHVAKNVYDVTSGDEQAMFDPPGFMREMAEKGWIGAKAGQGFFLKKDGVIYELNPETMEYEDRKKLKAPSIEKTKALKSKKQKIQTVVFADDRAGQLLWNIISPVLLYTAEKTYEIANDVLAVDEAMRWGFGWSMGPFELWDALGFRQTVEKMKADGRSLPTWVEEMFESGKEGFYTDGQFIHAKEYVPIRQHEKYLSLNHLIKTNTVMKNTGAAMIDIGDDVALLKFTSPNNSIGLDVIQMINKSIAEAEKNFKGLVIGNESKNFCVGANLMMMLMEAQDDNFFELDMVVKQFQQATSTIRYSNVPIVTAPFQMTLGGGAEISLPAASIQASHETYMGLVEVGVGLIPGGGGNKELYLRNLERYGNSPAQLQQVARETFETIATAKVSTSAAEAKENGFMNHRDGIVMNDSFVNHAAKQKVISLFNAGYQAPARKKIPVTGEAGYATLMLGAEMMKWGGYASEHDLKIAKKLAFVISGGRLKEGTLVDEQYLLDLEREAFLSLIAEPKSQQRMQHMLTKGKPLRN